MSDRRWSHRPVTRYRSGYDEHREFLDTEALTVRRVINLHDEEGEPGPLVMAGTAYELAPFDEDPEDAVPTD